MSMTAIIGAQLNTRPAADVQQPDDGLTQVNPSTSTTIDEIVARAQAALGRLARSYEDWLDLAEAVQVARTEAMRTAGTNNPRGKRFQSAVAAWLQDPLKSNASPQRRQSRQSTKRAFKKSAPPAAAVNKALRAARMPLFSSSVCHVQLDPADRIA
jgi:hypothetical protein